MLTNPIAALGRVARPVLALSIVVSLALPSVSATLLPYITEIVMSVLALAFLRADMGRLVSQWRRPDRLAVMLLMLLVVAPLAVYLVLGTLGVGAQFVVLVTMAAVAPPLGSSSHFAIYLKLDPEVALNLVIAGTFVTPLIAPLMLVGILDLPVEIDPLAMMLRLGFIIGLAALIAEVIRRLAGRNRIAAWAPTFDGLAVVAMVVFLFAIMGGVSDLILDEPMAALVLLATAMLAGFGLQLVFLFFAGLWSKLRGNTLSPTQATVCLIAGNRNMGLFLAALPLGLAAEVAPFVALYQVPMYTTPLIMAPVFAWALRRGGATVA